MVRSRVVVRAAALLDQRLALTVHGAVIRLAIGNRHPGSEPQPVRDLVGSSIRNEMGGPRPDAHASRPHSVECG
jgi:ABC-type protease/lipase transport system fused ATPase/permease subunit